MSTDLYCDDCYDDTPAGELAAYDDEHDLYMCVVLLLLGAVMVLLLELAHGC